MKILNDIACDLNQIEFELNWNLIQFNSNSNSNSIEEKMRCKIDGEGIENICMVLKK